MRNAGYDSVTPALRSTWSDSIKVYLSEVYDQTPENKLEKYLISGGTGWKSTSADFQLF